MRNRGFEKISSEINNDLVKLPTRSDPHSAGYDFVTPISFDIYPQETKKIETGIKAYMLDDEYLSIHIRSSMGIKYGFQLMNTTGIIDSSYYNNKGNEGNIIIAIKNTGAIVRHIDAGDRIAQGIFQKYLLADDDQPTNAERVGGIGSSGK